MNVHKQGNKQSSFILVAAITSLLISFLITTVFLRVFFGLSFLVLALLTYRFYHKPDEDQKKSELFTRRYYVWAIYTLAFVSSLLVFFLSVNKYSLNATWELFASLDPFEVLRVGSGFFVLLLFPGYVALRAFARLRLNNFLEKICLCLILSYIASTMVGLLLSQTIGLTSLNYLVAIWVFALTCEVLHNAFKRKGDDFHATPYKLTTIHICLIILICLILFFSTYLITLSANPTGYSLGGDIADYVSVTNSFLHGGEINVPYFWFQTFMGVASTTTGLDPLHAFVGMQFLIILFRLRYTFLY